MQISVAEIAKLLNAEVLGNSSALVHTVAKIEDGFEGALSFLSNMKYENFLYETKSSAVLVNNDFVPAQPVKTTMIKVENAYTAFTFLLEKFASQAIAKSGIESNSFIATNAQLGEDVYVAGFAYISNFAIVGKGTKLFPQVFLGENVKVGNNCIIYSGVKIYNDCEIGDNCIIHSGTIIGSDGFGFAPQADKSYKKIPQTGNVKIENDVEIGANCTIDRATMGSTIIRKGVKLDNLIQIAHNVEIGEHTVIAAQTGISGSTKIGKNCILAGQVGVAGHISIADGTIVGGQTGVTNSIKEGNKKWYSTPAFELNDALRSALFYKRLPEMFKRIEELEKKLKS